MKNQWMSVLHSSNTTNKHDLNQQILPLQSKVLQLQQELQNLKKMRQSKIKEQPFKKSKINNNQKEKSMKQPSKQEILSKQKKQKQQRQQFQRLERIKFKKQVESQLEVKNSKVADLIVSLKVNGKKSSKLPSRSQQKHDQFNEFSKPTSNVNQLCKNLQTAQKSNPRKKKLKINLTQLKDQNNQVHSNIFNVAVAEIMNLDEKNKLVMIDQIKSLKSKLEILKEQSQIKNKSNYDQNQSYYHAFDIKSSAQNWMTPTNVNVAVNKSMKGRLYRKSELKTAQKSIQVHLVADPKPIVKNIQLKKNTNKLTWNPQMSLNLNKKSQSFLRSRGQSSGRIYNISSFRGQSAVPTTSRTSMDITIPFKKSFKRRAQSNDKYATISELNHKKYDFDQEINEKRINIKKHSEQKCIQLEEAPTQFLDNFRDYISKKAKFPKLPQTPTPYDSYTDLQTLGKVIFALFDVFVDKQVQNNKKYEYKIIKYKNCVLFQLCPQKNIVWYYDQKFYFGGWDINIYGQGIKQGFGIDYSPDQHVYQGYFSNSKRNGYGIMINSFKVEQLKNIIYEGEWNQGIKQGVGYQIDQDSEYIGQFKEGIRDGKGKVKTKNSLYEGDIVKNIKQGKGYERLTNGDQYYGEFKNNRFHGKGQYKWKNSAYYNGMFKNGFRHGSGIWISNLNQQSFDTYKGAYEENKKNGYGVYKWAKGAIYEGYFKNDQRHDEGLMRYPNGKAAKFMWKDGNIARKIYSVEQQNYRKNRGKKDNNKKQDNEDNQIQNEQKIEDQSQNHLTFMSGMKINLQNAAYSQFDRESSYFFNNGYGKSVRRDSKSQRI